MRVIAFDCAGAQCAAAIVADGRTLAERRIASDRGHAQMLMPLLVELTAEAGLRFGDFDRFAVTTGPGSFTGIRVALAAAHGLALGTGRPIVGVSVFDAIAAQSVAAHSAPSPTARLLVAIDSRRAELFVQLFDAHGTAQSEPAMLAPAAVADWAGPEPVILAGDGAAQLAPHLPAAIVAGLPHLVDPATLARIAATRPAGEAPAPFYLRPPDAVPARAR
jgi:tRNA threonylcarbamoyladenosine biosynthesis protein TsaB